MEISKDEKTQFLWATLPLSKKQKVEFFKDLQSHLTEEELKEDDEFDETLFKIELVDDKDLKKNSKKNDKKEDTK